MLIYRINGIKKLKEKGFNTTRILKENIINQSTMQYMRTGKVTVDAMEKLCTLLQLPLESVVEFIPDDRYEVLWNAGYFKDSEIPMPEPKKKKEKKVRKNSSADN